MLRLRRRLVCVASPVMLAMALQAPAQTVSPAASAAAVGVASAATDGVTDTAAELPAALALLAQLEQRAAAGSTQPLLEEQRSLAARLVLLLRAENTPAQAAPAPPPPAVPADLQGAGPYRVGDVDTLRDLRESVLGQSRTLQHTLRGLDAQVDALLAVRRRADETLRLKGDQLARAREEDARERLRSEADVARLEARIGALELRRTDRDREQARTRLATLNEHADALHRTLARVRGRQRLDEADVQAVAQAAVAMRRALAQSGRQLERQIASRQAASDRTGGGSEAARRELQALHERLGLIATLDLLEAGREGAWRQRQRVLQAQPGSELDEAVAVLQRSVEQLGSRAQAAEQQLAQARLALRLQRLRVDGLAPGAPEASEERSTRDAVQALVDTLEQALDGFVGLQRLLGSTLEDVAADRRADAQPWHHRAWAALQQAGRVVWQYELFSVSDTTRIDGRDVTMDYGVTVGKSVGVFVLFLIGWLVAVRLSRAGIGLLVRHGAVSTALGKVLHRWLVSILLLGVLMVVLKLARIPLTVFAFLGGALAIGLGFGTQNIIKNLISGVIILFERKLRVGDIVTIDGVSGTVTSVDLRASTVRGFDGVDSIVPNSQLLEKRVGNWSLGSRSVRRVIAVGLRYGQSAREGAARMLACAAADGDVLADPAPEVLFADFGADAQMLNLQYWIRLGGARSATTIESDLRHAITDAFADAGLVMAFAQRDVHVDSVAPLEVRVVRVP